MRSTLPAGLFLSLLAAISCGVAQADPLPESLVPPVVDCSGDEVEVSSKSFRIAAMGDLSFSGIESGNKGVFDDFVPYTRKADFVLANLEGVITERETSTKKFVPGRSYAFRFPPSIAQTMLRTPIHAVTIANNHSNDYGPEGLQDTFRYLKAAGIDYTGLQDTYSIKEYDGKKVGLIGFGFYSRHNDMNDIDNAVELVRRVRRQADLVVVTFHAGAEGAGAALLQDGTEIFLGEKRGDSRRFARSVIGAGADIVIGHGPHVVRAAECIKGKPVIYSLGNFVSAGGLSIRQLANVTVFLEAYFDRDGDFEGVRVLPVTFGENRLPVLDPSGRGLLLMNWLAEKGEGRLKDFHPIIFKGFESKEAGFKSWLINEGTKPK